MIHTIPIESAAGAAWQSALSNLRLRQASLMEQCVSGFPLPREAVLAARETAWLLYKDVFETWAAVEQELQERGMTPAQLLNERLYVRSRPEFGAFSHTNFPDASRLINKLYPAKHLLERADEKNPGAPPSLHAVYERKPQSRGKLPLNQQQFVEILDHAALRLHDLDVVHDRTVATSSILVPRILRALRGGRDYCLFDVACGGNRLARNLGHVLRNIHGIDAADLARVHVFGVDLDERADPYTFGAELGWNQPGHDINVTVYIGNVSALETQSAIQSWLLARGRTGFDAVTALGILDYFDCPVPGADRVYIPEAFAKPFAYCLRNFVAHGGVLIAAVFSEEGRDNISLGGRHLFANWHLRYATRRLMQERFPFLRSSDFRPMRGSSGTVNSSAHFMVHDVTADD